MRHAHTITNCKAVSPLHTCMFKPKLYLEACRVYIAIVKQLDVYCSTSKQQWQRSKLVVLRLAWTRVDIGGLS